MSNALSRLARLSEEQIEGFRVVLHNWLSRDHGDVVARWDMLCDMALESCQSETSMRQEAALMNALGNCYTMARREIQRHKNGGDPLTIERWGHVKRFCEETGLREQILRASFPTEITDGSEEHANDKREGQAMTDKETLMLAVKLCDEKAKELLGQSFQWGDRDRQDMVATLKHEAHGASKCATMLQGEAAKLSESVPSATSVLPDAIIERCARVVERIAEARFEEHGTREYDTNATYYQGSQAEFFEAMDEENEDCAKAIRSLKSTLADSER